MALVGDDQVEGVDRNIEAISIVLGFVIALLEHPFAAEQVDAQGIADREPHAARQGGIERDERRTFVVGSPPGARGELLRVERDFERMRDYVRGRLPDDERRTFEDRLVRDPVLVREFEHTLRLREGLEQLREQGYFAGLAPLNTRLLTMWMLALAAAAIAALAVILWVQPRTERPGVLLASPGSGATTGAVPLVSARFTFVALRGNTSYDLDRPPAGLIEFRASPEGHVANAHYRMTLARVGQDGATETLGTLTDMVLGPDGYLHGYGAVSGLAAGHYLLRVEPVGPAAGSALSFPFELHDR